MLVFVLLSLGAASLLRLQTAYASPYTDIDIDTAYNMIVNGSYPNLVVLDVRNQSEYDGGHIYGAVWIPVWELEARIGELAGHENHEIIVYCLAGGRSATASGILDSHNFTMVYNMLGGITAWLNANYPIWNSTVHNINTTFNYDTIQAAIDAPQTQDGHIILVDAGTYYEHVVVDKSISLIGENRSTTVIDGNGTGNVIDITAYYANVTGFTIRNGTNGIFIETYDYNIISGNIVIYNQYGIHLFSTCLCHPTSENTIRNNIIKNNSIGVSLEKSNYNVIYHNNFINNTVQANVTADCVNIWDDGYPSGGNYWSNYADVDLCSGPYQNETGSDGIVDSPYGITNDNRDNYPLMGPISFFNACTWNETTYYVHTVSNSTVSDFNFNPENYLINFNVTESDVTVGFCRVAIPRELLWCDDPEQWQVRVNNTLIENRKTMEDTYYTYIYFTYNQTTQNVEVIGIHVIPEWSTLKSMLLILIVLTVAIAIHKQRLPKTPFR